MKSRHHIGKVVKGVFFENLKEKKTSISAQEINGNL
jgi:hypothetical protein